MQLDDKLFHYAVDLKRQGKYIDAIIIYQIEIKKMLQENDLSEFTTYAHALSKCYYLIGDYDAALACYDAVMAKNVLQYPVLRDYVNDDPQFFRFVTQWAIHIGYALNGYNDDKKDLDYRNAIAGHGGDYDEDRHIEQGYRYVCRLLDEYIKQNSKDYVFDDFIKHLRLMKI